MARTVNISPKSKLARMRKNPRRRISFSGKRVRTPRALRGQFPTRVRISGDPRKLKRAMRKHGYRVNPSEVLGGKSIETKYLPPSNVRGARIKASVIDGNRIQKSIVVPFDHGADEYERHLNAALQMRDKMKWTGDLVGVGTRTGYVFGFRDMQRFQKNPRKRARRDDPAAVHIDIHSHNVRRNPRKRRVKAPNWYAGRKDYFAFVVHPRHISWRSQNGLTGSEPRIMNQPPAIQVRNIASYYGLTGRDWEMITENPRSRAFLHVAKTTHRPVYVVGVKQSGGGVHYFGKRFHSLPKARRVAQMSANAARAVYVVKKVKG